MREVGQLGAERGAEVVAAALDDHQLELREALDQAVDGGQVDRRVLADRGVRAAAGLDADDALGAAARARAPRTARLPWCRCRWSRPRCRSGRAALRTGAGRARSCPTRPVRRRRRAELGTWYCGPWLTSRAKEPRVLRFVLRADEREAGGEVADRRRRRCAARCVRAAFDHAAARVRACAGPRSDRAATAAAQR